MKQQPNRFVTKTLIEIFDILLRQKNRARAKLGQRSGSDLIAHFILDRASRPANPEIFRFMG
jgi:hypothetical protein